MYTIENLKTSDTAEHLNYHLKLSETLIYPLNMVDTLKGSIN